MSWWLDEIFWWLLLRVSFWGVNQGKEKLQDACQIWDWVCEWNPLHDRVHMCVRIACVCVCVLKRPGSFQITCQRLTSPTPQSTLHRGQLGPAPRLLWCQLSFFLFFLPHSTFFFPVLHSVMSSAPADLASQCCFLPEVNKVRIVSDTEVSRRLPLVLVRVADFWQSTIHTCPNTTQEMHIMLQSITYARFQCQKRLLLFWDQLSDLATIAGCKWMPWAKRDANWSAE